MAISAATHAMGAIPPDQSSTIHRNSEPESFTRVVPGGVRPRGRARAGRRIRARGCRVTHRLTLVRDRGRLPMPERRQRMASRRGHQGERSSI